MTPDERATLHLLISERIRPRGTPLGDAAIRLRGLPCPLGESSDRGYTKLGCRCDGCREGHRLVRLARLQRRRALAG